ncbi:MAG: glycosyltransferase family 4 protein [Proteobacteria bacterium]|nr:glycosyltransferase family 4 protein [Pseudomonadota bacterium]
MRIAFHDYPGHAFPVQLARALARRGHDVLFLHFADFQSPKGALAPAADDPPGLRLQPVALGEAHRKYDFARRWMQDQRYGRRLAAQVQAFRPDVVLGGNGPLDPQARLQRAARALGAGFVFWLQDAYGVAIDQLLRRKLPGVGALVGGHYRALERRLWRASDAIVAITEDFRPMLDAAGVAAERVTVIENWAALDELPQRPRRNAWADAHDLADKRVLLYAGTMGLKHDPELLCHLARRFRGVPDVRVVVVSEGIGADHIARVKAAEQLDNLVLLPFAPYQALPDVIATGDVLVVVLEAGAGIYSVPSKLLTYLCAGRAILGALPLDNLATRIVAQAGAGLVAAPGDLAGFLAAAATLLDQPDRRAAAGAAARAYAERSFDIAAIAARFDAVLAAAARATSRRPPGLV